LLDEPTNHLDLTTIEWLERELDARRSAMVIVSHDRRLLSNLSRSTVWLDRGTTRRLERGFAHFEEWRDAVLAEEERDQHKLERKIVAEEHWLRYGVSGRRKRNVKRLGNLHALRQQRRDYRGAAGNANLAAAEAVDAAAAKAKGGAGLSRPLAAAGIFPARTIHLLQLGEEAAQLAAMSLKAADIHEEQARLMMQRLVALAVPLITIAMGLIVAGIISALLTAMLSLNDLAN